MTISHPNIHLSIHIPMKIILLFLALAFFALPLHAQQPSRPAVQMKVCTAAFLMKGPEWKSDSSNAFLRLQEDHAAEMLRLLRTGDALAAGPFLNGTDVRGVIILKTDSIPLAEELLSLDPLIQRGHFRLAIHPWFTATNYLRSADTAGNFSQYLFGILRRGPAWTPGQSEETKKIQQGHMANIQRMADLDKLVLAGPFMDGGDWRGIFIFRNIPIEEVRTLTEADPAIASGRLVLDVYEWMLPAGILP